MSAWMNREKLLILVMSLNIMFILYHTELIKQLIFGSAKKKKKKTFRKYTNNFSILIVVKAGRDRKVRLKKQYVGYWLYIYMIYHDIVTISCLHTFF